MKNLINNLKSDAEFIKKGVKLIMSDKKFAIPFIAIESCLAIQIILYIVLIVMEIR